MRKTIITIGCLLFFVISMITVSSILEEKNSKLESIIEENKKEIEFLKKENINIDKKLSNQMINMNLLYKEIEKQHEKAFEFYDDSFEMNVQRMMIQN